MSIRVQVAMRAATVAGMVALTGCAGSGGLGLGGSVTTGSLAGQASTPAVGEPARAGVVAQSTAAGEALRPVSPAIETARALRLKGDKSRALVEIEKARRTKPGDREIAREMGFLALELGQLDKALTALNAANDPAKPDLSTLSALGTVHASSGNQKEAQAHFERALAVDPSHRQTLNNLALSYALEGNLAKAESTLRQASKGATSRQIQENLALVLALAGKYEDAERLAAGLMPKDKVAANMAYVRSLKQSGG